MIRRSLIVAGLTVLTAFAADKDSSRPRVRLGGIGVGVNYMNGGGYGPWGYAPFGYRPWWGLYDPFWSSAFLHPGLYTGFSQGPSLGEIKLEAPRDASLYIDGAYAGSTQKLKSIWLEPGIYNLQVENPAGAKYRKKVYVLTGKTLNLRAELQP